MKVIKGIENFNAIDKLVVTLGTYDGVHKGHQQILSKMKQTANGINGKTMVITFWPHPRYVLKKDDDKLHLLTTLDDKIFLLEKFGIDYLLVINFTLEFSKQDPNAFIKKLLVDKIGAHTIVIGYDHRFGKDRAGTYEFLVNKSKKHGFEVEKIDAFNLNNVAISSTKIRSLLDNKKIQEANKLLGYEFFIQGKVVKGLGLGKELEFPTANISVTDLNKHIPSDGIYVVRISIAGKEYHGMLNSGDNPTIEGKGRSIEVHIFDFNGNIYDQEIQVNFLCRLRDEMKFDNTEQLTRQMYLDKENSLKFLKNYQRLI